MEILRLAPSPTNCNEDKNNRGAHIGTIRTALYNYAIRCQDKDSKLILRVEDTDESRSNVECLQCLIRDFDLCNITFDAGFSIKDGKVSEYNNTGMNFGTLLQSKRNNRHDELTQELLKKGFAYEKDNAVFMKSPSEDVEFQDEILGKIKFKADQVQDFVLRKSSGIASFYAGCTYDDSDMGITLVIRGQEHVNTAARQVVIQKALGLKTPKYAHIPLIMNPDGQKMSKRQTSGQVNLWDFLKDGYHIDAIINYIALLGWSPRNKVEFFDINYLIDNFDIKKVVKTHARFDYAKLNKFNERYLSSHDVDNLKHIIKQWCMLTNTQLQENHVHLASKIHKGRAKNIKACAENTLQIIQRLREIDKIVKKTQKIQSFANSAKKLMERLNNLTTWNAHDINKAVVDSSQSLGVKHGEIYKGLSDIFLGDISGPSVQELIHEIGKDEAIKAIYTATI